MCGSVVLSCYWERFANIHPCPASGSLPDLPALWNPGKNACCTIPIDAMYFKLDIVGMKVISGLSSFKHLVLNIIDISLLSLTRRHTSTTRANLVNAVQEACSCEKWKALQLIQRLKTAYIDTSSPYLSPTLVFTLNRIIEESKRCGFWGTILFIDKSVC